MRRSFSTFFMLVCAVLSFIFIQTKLTSSSASQPKEIPADEKNVLYINILEKKVAHLQQLLDQKTQTQPENKPQIGDWKFAPIIQKEPNPFSHSFWIAIGYNSGVQLDQIVCYGDQVVGIIDKVTKEKSRVKMITDPAVAVAFKAAANTEIKGYLQGRADDYRTHNSVLKGQCPAMLIGSFSSIQGSEIVTTGMDGLFFPGLVIGTVVKTKNLEINGLQIEIQPTVDLSSIEHVFVLTH